MHKIYEQKRLKQILIGACSLAVMAGAMPAFADNPSVSAVDFNATDEQAQAPDISMKTLEVDVTLAGGYAQTHVVASFVTDTGGRIEGDFLLDMPEGAIITGYGLDVNGTMIDGVLLEKAEAKKAFEDRIREGVDPGLAEATSTNAFKTRVFPFVAGVPRTISLTFVAPVSPASPYVLPLETDKSLDKFSLNVASKDGPARPDVTLPAGKALDWQSGQNVEGALTLEKTKLDGALEITPQSMPVSSIETGPLGDRFLSVSVPVNSGENALRTPKTIQIIWDTSLSHEDNAKDEQAFLSRVLQAYPDADYGLTLFDTEVERLGEIDADDLERRVEGLVYNGATDFGGLFETYAEDGAKSDLCLVFTDGRKTLGEGAAASLPCATYMVSAAEDADRPTLAYVGQIGGGGFVDLVNDSVEAGLGLISRVAPRLERLDVDGRAASEDTVWSFDGDFLRVIAPVDSRARRADITVNGQKTRIDLAKSPVSEGGIVSASWAHQQMAALRAVGTERDALVKLSKDYGVASDETSFLVLERVADYVENDVPLPSQGFDKTARAEYEQMVEAKIEEDKDSQDSRRDFVLTEWRKVTEWYGTEFKAGKPDQKASEVNEDGLGGDISNGRPPPPPPPPQATAPAAEPSLEENLADFGAQDTIAVTGSRRRSADEAEQAPGAQSAVEAAKSISIEPWSPDRPYLSDVVDLSVEQFLDGYIAQRKEFGSVPSFYLEMSDAAARAKGDAEVGRALARDIVLSALELESANNDTFTAVGERLVTLGYYEDAVWLYTQLTKLESFRPQPWRNLALALAAQADATDNRREKRALYEQALTHLDHVIETPWGGWAQGIEVISIMEANNILRRLEAAGGKSELIHKSFRDLLDVDLRVTVSWNIDGADMDMHVVEPTKEIAFYGNPLTKIGGRMSNDMTNGYGPEEYIIRDAIPGKYQVKMDYFSSDAANPNGAIVIQANIYRNWGRANEVVKTVDLEFTEDTGEQYLVATIDVE